MFSTRNTNTFLKFVIASDSDNDSDTDPTIFDKCEFVIEISPAHLLLWFEHDGYGIITIYKYVNNNENMQIIMKKTKNKNEIRSKSMDKRFWMFFWMYSISWNKSTSVNWFQSLGLHADWMGLVKTLFIHKTNRFISFSRKPIHRWLNSCKFEFD